MFLDPDTEVAGGRNGTPGGGVGEEAGGGDDDLPALKILMEVTENMTTPWLSAFASCNATIGLREFFTVDVEGVSLTGKDVITATYHEAVAVTLFEGRNFDDGAGEKNFPLPKRNRHGATAAIGRGTIAERSKFPIELAEGLLTLFPAGLSGIEIRGEPILHPCRVGDLTVARAGVVLGEFFRRVKSEVVPLYRAEISAERSPFIVVDPSSAVDIRESVDRSAEELILPFGALALRFRCEGFLIAGIGEVACGNAIEHDGAESFLVL